MKKIRIILAIIVCKFLIMAGKLAGKKGSSTPGGIALKISPDVLKYLSKQVRREVLLKTSQGEGEICYVLINYTALFDTQNNLRALEDK